MKSEQKLRPKKAADHDESPSIVTDHAFTPKGEWWTLCGHCNLAESAHRETTNPPVRFHYVGDDTEEVND